MKTIRLSCEDLDSFENERSRAEQLRSFLLMMQTAFLYGEYDISSYIPAVTMALHQASEHELKLNELTQLLSESVVPAVSKDRDRATATANSSRPAK